MVQQRESALRPAPATPFDTVLGPVGPGVGASVDDHPVAMDDAGAPTTALDTHDDAVAPVARGPVGAREPRPAAAAKLPARPAREPVPDVAGARPPGGPGGSVARPDRSARPDAGNGAAGHTEPSSPRPSCTAPQLRRFIKSRVYIPMHELRRRFAIEGEDDDVCAVQLDSRSVYVGLPPAEGRLLGELFRNGEVGYELSMDPETPIVVGVYSMRPISRP